MRVMSMTERRTGKVYDLWSRMYDRTFVVMARKHQRIAMAQLPLRPGDNVLDLGVGTGVTMPMYPRSVHVVGMDLSSGMLAHATAKRRQLELDHCHLVQGDAMHPPFAPKSFDHVIISHTISVVSNPASVMRWATRLVKPGGRIVVLNHFQSSQPILAAVGKVLNPLCMRMGWRTDVPLEILLGSLDLDLEYCFRLHLVDLWKIVVLRRKSTNGAGGVVQPSNSLKIAPSTLTDRVTAEPVGLPSGS